MKRVLLLLPLLLIAGCAPVPAAREQAMTQTEQNPRERVLMDVTPAAIREYVEAVITDRYGPEVVRQANGAASSVMAASVRGRFNSGGPDVNVAIRTSTGWNSWKSGTPRPLPPEVSREIDRLLASSSFWGEPDRFPAMDCPDSGAHLLVVRHAGRGKVTRQSCSPANLVGRLLTTVLEERVPAA